MRAAVKQEVNGFLVQALHDLLRHYEVEVLSRVQVVRIHHLHVRLAQRQLPLGSLHDVRVRPLLPGLRPPDVQLCRVPFQVMPQGFGHLHTARKRNQAAFTAVPRVGHLHELQQLEALQYHPLPRFRRFLLLLRPPRPRCTLTACFIVRSRQPAAYLHHPRKHFVKPQRLFLSLFVVEGVRHYQRIFSPERQHKHPVVHAVPHSVPHALLENLRVNLLCRALLIGAHQKLVLLLELLDFKQVLLRIFRPQTIVFLEKPPQLCKQGIVALITLHTPHLVFAQGPPHVVRHGTPALLVGEGRQHVRHKQSRDLHGPVHLLALAAKRKHILPTHLKRILITVHTPDKRCTRLWARLPDDVVQPFFSLFVHRLFCEHKNLTLDFDAHPVARANTPSVDSRCLL